MLQFCTGWVPLLLMSCVFIASQYFHSFLSYNCLLFFPKNVNTRPFCAQVYLPSMFQIWCFTQPSTDNRAVFLWKTNSASFAAPVFAFMHSCLHTRWIASSLYICVHISWRFFFSLYFWIISSLLLLSTFASPAYIKNWTVYLPICVLYASGCRLYQAEILFPCILLKPTKFVILLHYLLICLNRLTIFATILLFTENTRTRPPAFKMYACVHRHIGLFQVVIFADKTRVRMLYMKYMHFSASGCQLFRAEILVSTHLLQVRIQN